MVHGLTPPQFVLFPICSLRKGLIKELGEPKKSRREKFISKITEVISCQEFISHHILTAPSEYPEFLSLEPTMTPICPPSPEAVVSSGRVEKSPHEQEIKFFAKVRAGLRNWRGLETGWALIIFYPVSLFSSPPHPQILLPLINQYFTNHCLYFLSTPAKVLGSGGHASNKEKEMITRWAALCSLTQPPDLIALYSWTLYSQP